MLDPVRYPKITIGPLPEYDHYRMNAKHSSRALPRPPNIHNDKLHASGEPEENMWSSMLDGVASGKRLPEKNILVLGRSPNSLREMTRAGTERMI